MCRVSSVTGNAKLNYKMKMLPEQQASAQVLWRGKGGRGSRAGNWYGFSWSGLATGQVNLELHKAFLVRCGNGWKNGKRWLIVFINFGRVIDLIGL